MTENPNRKLPQPTAGDDVHMLVRAALSAVPLTGGPAAELFAAAIVPPLARRRDEWFEGLAVAVKELERKVEGFKVESLSSNEAFISVVMQATALAVKTRQKEKLEALRNAVLNTALPSELDEDTRLMYLNLIDTLTPLHLRMLLLLKNPESWENVSGIATQPGAIGNVFHLIEAAFPEMRGRLDLCKKAIRDLESDWLIGNSQIRPIAGGALDVPETTSIGKGFLAFIESPRI